MATESYWTNRGLQRLASVDFDAIDFRAMLVQSAVANATGKDHNFVSDVTGVSTEVTATGYARVDIAAPTVTEDDSGNQVTVSWSTISWGALGGAANTAVAHLVIYEHNAADSAAPVIAYFGGASLPFTTNGSTVSSTTPTLTLTSTAT